MCKRSSCVSYLGRRGSIPKPGGGHENSFGGRTSPATFGARRAYDVALTRSSRSAQAGRNRSVALLARVARATWRGYLKWPAPVWRLRGYGTVTLGDHAFRFFDLARPPNSWWAWEARNGRWEPRVIEFLTATLRAGDVFLDVGAYFGPYTLLASRLVGSEGRVYAFEPDPVARALLARNVRENGARNVTIVPYVVQAQPGTAWLSSERLGNALTSVDPSHGLLEVEAVTLAGFCREHGVTPAVVKIDVEGGEASILTEKAEPFVSRLRALVVEIHERRLRASGQQPAQLLELFARWGELIELDARTTANFNVALIPRAAAARFRVAGGRTPTGAGGPPPDAGLS